MSTLETAIVFSAVMLVLCGLIVLPADLCAKTVIDVREAYEDITDYPEDSISVEGLNTFLTGISENYRIIYGAFSSEMSGEAQDVQE